MAMLRPGGKPYKIALQSVPGLAQHQKRRKPISQPPQFQIGMENLIMEINENGGKIPKEYQK